LISKGLGYRGKRKKMEAVSTACKDHGKIHFIIIDTLSFHLAGIRGKAALPFMFHLQRCEYHAPQNMRENLIDQSTRKSDGPMSMIRQNNVNINQICLPLTRGRIKLTEILSFGVTNLDKKGIFFFGQIRD
jgi:hypothetical protein